MGEACASGIGSGQPTAPVAQVRATSLTRHQLGRFLALLAPRSAGRSTNPSPDPNSDLTLTLTLT